jgi:tol-pal system protein YbgF
MQTAIHVQRALRVHIAAARIEPGGHMKLHRGAVVVSVLAGLAFSIPGFAVSKEIVQLQTQVQQLQDQMALMQQSFNERMGIMRHLVEQQSDTVNKVDASVQALQQALQQALTKNHDDQTARADQLSGQIQALNDSVDELKARLAKVSTQLEQMAAAAQNLTQPAPTAAPVQPPMPPDALYQNALGDYNADKLDLAAQEFGDYLRFYPTANLAGNAQFYLADIEYRQENYAAAIKDYDKVLDQYPGGNKTSAAHLKKGMALIQMGKREDGIKELNAVIQRYPHSNDATTAREQLRKLRPPARH